MEQKVLNGLSAVTALADNVFWQDNDVELMNPNSMIACTRPMKTTPGIMPTWMQGNFARPES